MKKPTNSEIVRVKQWAKGAFSVDRTVRSDGVSVPNTKIQVTFNRHFHNAIGVELVFAYQGPYFGEAYFQTGMTKNTPELKRLRSDLPFGIHLLPLYNHLGFNTEYQCERCRVGWSEAKQDEKVKNMVRDCPDGMRGVLKSFDTTKADAPTTRICRKCNSETLFKLAEQRRVEALEEKVAKRGTSVLGDNLFAARMRRRKRERDAGSED